MTEQEIRLGRAERSITDYLYMRETEELGVSTQKEVLDYYNEINGTSYKNGSFMKIMTRLVKKKLIGRAKVGMKYYYRITWQGILIKEKS